MWSDNPASACEGPGGHLKVSDEAEATYSKQSIAAGPTGS
jgi:hypothetical protein